MSKQNRLFLVLSILFIGLLAFLWYRYHPSSPYYSKTTYQFLFPEIGTLEAGNSLKVNGIDAGHILSVKLVDNGVLVRANVLDGSEISKDSEIKVMNLGLVGERMIHILQGFSSDLYTPQDTIKGKYDPGSTKLVVSARAMFQDLGHLGKTLKTVLDSTINHPKNEGRFSRLGTHLTKIQKKVNRLASLSKKDIKSILSELDKGVQNIEQHQIQWNQSGEALSKKGSEITQNISELQSSLQNLSTLVSTNYKENGSLVQLTTPAFKNEFNQTWNHYIDLHQLLITRELQFNVDFF